MNKEEAIKEAYGIRYDELKEFINIDGVFVGRTGMITDVEFEKWSFIAAAKPIGRGKLISGSRPKSLQGIEDNNMWLKIESEENLPKEGNLFWVMKINYDYPVIERFYNNDSEHWVKCFTHYQPIEKPKPPIY